MKSVRWCRAARVIGPAAVLFQFTACFGPDPQLFFTTTVANAVLVNLVTLVFNTVFGGGLAVTG